MQRMDDGQWKEYAIVGDPKLSFEQFGYLSNNLALYDLKYI